MAATLPSPVEPALPAAPPDTAPRKDEATRRAELKRMKRMASGLLVVALAVFVVALLLEPAYPWMGFVRATAEASLVGGLADWFAVTALFRRPLGLPIPHTAIIQTQKERIGRVLGNFVQNHFLSKDVLAVRLKSMRVAERAARWLSEPEHGSRLARHLASGVARTMEAVPDQKVRELIQETAVSRIKSVPVAPILGNVLSAVASDRRHQMLLDEALRLASDLMEKNREELRVRIKEESPWWVPGAVDHAFQRKLEGAFQRLVDEIKLDPYHPLRQKFDEAFTDFVERLKTSPELSARAEAIKADLLRHPAVEDFASSLWERARDYAERLTTQEDSTSLEPLARGITAVGGSLVSNPDRLEELDDFLTTFAASVLERHRHEVGALIAETVRLWDPEVAAERLELAVGRDLQFIRLNGTLVGGLAGLLIYTVSLLLK
ncbi:MAG TPA: DUF445 domain-containing protein [Gemmatimonadales bacterium]|nr:DUF445 domain-containing protein [Gemmatimonadales bacterium]